MLLLARQEGTAVIVKVNTRTGGWTVLAENVGDRVVLDAAHGILACVCEDPDSRLPAVRVARLGAEAEWRTITLPTGARTDRLEILQSSRTGRGVARVAVAAPGTIRAGTSHRLRANAFGLTGDRIAFDSTTLRWRSDAPNTLAIDPQTGMAVAIRPGRATVSVTAGGWRGDSLTLSVEPSGAELVHDELWQDGMTSWRSFGDPLPFVGPHADFGTALHINGDGVFTSGTYFQKTFPASAGVTVEVEVSTPITRDKWQVMVVDLAPSIDSVLLARWDHRASFPPGHRIRQGNTCGIGYPNGEGSSGRQRLLVSAGIRNETPGAAATLASGKPYTLRLMLGADGRCQVAINGEPISVSANALPVDLPLRLWLLGNSVDTDIAVGRVRVWLGDPGGVDWLKLQKGVGSGAPARMAP